MGEITLFDVQRLQGFDKRTPVFCIFKKGSRRGSRAKRGGAATAPIQLVPTERPGAVPKGAIGVKVSTHMTSNRDR